MPCHGCHQLISKASRRSSSDAGGRPLWHSWIFSKICRQMCYGSIPIHTIFSGMNIHLPAILMWTTGVQGFDTLPYHSKHLFNLFTMTAFMNSSTFEPLPQLMSSVCWADPTAFLRTVLFRIPTSNAIDSCVDIDWFNPIKTVQNHPFLHPLCRMFIDESSWHQAPMLWMRRGCRSVQDEIKRILEHPIDGLYMGYMGHIPVESTVSNERSRGHFTITGKYM